MKISKKKVELLMAAKCMSYTELNKSIGSKKYSVYRMVSSQTNNPKTVGRVAHALGVPVTAIIEDEE